MEIRGKMGSGVPPFKITHLTGTDMDPSAINDFLLVIHISVLQINGDYG